MVIEEVTPSAGKAFRSAKLERVGFELWSPFRICKLQIPQCQFPGGSFDGIVDIIGGKPPRGFAPGTNVQDALMSLNPADLIIEPPGADQDFKVQGIRLTVPIALGCPSGTSPVK